ncbi:restriction endonuclease subunit S [Bifidobacterium bifidum]|nr:restriction endonuclease subunit S [Bifidobacterium bifidum]MCU4299341.1 restriction endonuclease subunit S [Bifidobacterium bifidum]
MMTEQAKVPAIRFAGFTDPWEQRKLGELVVIERGGSPRPIDEYITDDTNGLNWVKIGDAPSLGRYISKTSEKIKPEGLSKTRQVHPGDLILSNSMSFGRPYIMAIEGCIHDGWLLIRDEPKSFDPMYLCHMLGTPKMLNQYRMLASGSTVNNLNKELVSNASILMPCKSEQKVIGQFFNHLDDLITLHQRKYDKLVVFKKSMLEKMFPKDGESVPEIRFAGFTDPWEQRKFVDFVEASGIRNKDNLQLESYSVSNDRGFVPQDEQFENGGTMRDADKTAYWIVEPGSFAYNPARINVGSIGYQSTRKNVIVSSLYEVFKTDRSCDDRFLWHWFKSSLFTKQIEMLQEGGVRLYFFFDKLQKSEIWMPNVDEQRIIGQQFDQLDSLITLHQRKLELLRNIKKSLLDKMFV